MPTSLPTGVLLRCFARSFVLQAAWNTRGMQNLGFAYALWPALRHLYPEAGAREAAVTRHLEPFNTQPYMAEAVLGGAIHHETRIAAGAEPTTTATDFKRAVAGPLAAIGDAFFWAALRPAAAALALVSATFVGAWALLVFLVVYNAFHLSARVYLFVQGVRRGDGVLEVIGAMRVPEKTVWVKRVAAVAIPLAAVAWMGSHEPALGYALGLMPVVAVTGGAVLVFLCRRGLLRSYAAVAVGVAVGLVFGLLSTMGVA